MEPAGRSCGRYIPGWRRWSASARPNNIRAPPAMNATLRPASTSGVHLPVGSTSMCRSPATVSAITTPASTNGRPTIATHPPPSRSSMICGEVCRNGGGGAASEPLCAPVAISTLRRVPLRRAAGDGFDFGDEGALQLRYHSAQVFHNLLPLFGMQIPGGSAHAPALGQLSRAHSRRRQ